MKQIRCFLIKILLISVAMLLNVFFIASCSSSVVIVYGNYENYMDPNLQSEIANKYNVSFNVYGADIRLLSDFKNKIYDIGTVSTYTLKEMQKRDLLEKIDWKQFHLTGIQNATDALTLFSPTVQKILCPNGKDSENLLNYGIPYFLQSFVFAYWKSDEQQLSTPPLKENLSWESLLNWVKENYTYFNNNRLACVEDPRTLFSIANLVANNNQSVNVSSPPICRPDDLDSVFNRYNKIFAAFSKILNPTTMHSNKNVMGLNTDSYVVVNKLDSKEVNGAFLFNGDALFAAEGGEYYQDDPPIPGHNFFVLTPTVTSTPLDMIVINSDDQNDPAKISKIYDVIKKIALEGSDSQTFQESAGPVRNFEYVAYTSPLKSVNEYVTKKGGYLENDVNENDAWPQDIKSVVLEELKSIYNVNDQNLSIEVPLTQVERAALLYSFVQFKGNM